MKPDEPGPRSTKSGLTTQRQGGHGESQTATTGVFWSATPFQIAFRKLIRSSLRDDVIAGDCRLSPAIFDGTGSFCRVRSKRRTLKLQRKSTHKNAACVVLKR